jgi:ketosteroid isomerase-like protein
MSQENAALAYRYGDALNAREVPDGLLAPGFVMVNADTAVTAGTFRGAQGVIQWTRDILDLVEEDSPFSIEKIVAHQDDFVVATVGIEGTAERSRMPIAFRWAAAFWCSDGRLTRVVGYLQLREALKAVGLRE